MEVPAPTQSSLSASPDSSQPAASLTLPSQAEAGFSSAHSCTVLPVTNYGMLPTLR